MFDSDIYLDNNFRCSFIGHSSIQGLVAALY